jgi:hypothetical protein
MCSVCRYFISKRWRENVSRCNVMAVAERVHNYHKHVAPGNWTILVNKQLTTYPQWRELTVNWTLQVNFTMSAWTCMYCKLIFQWHVKHITEIFWIFLSENVSYTFLVAHLFPENCYITFLIQYTSKGVRCIIKTQTAESLNVTQLIWNTGMMLLGWPEAIIRICVYIVAASDGLCVALNALQSDSGHRRGAKNTRRGRPLHRRPRVKQQTLSAGDCHVSHMKSWRNSWSW